MQEREAQEAMARLKELFPPGLKLPASTDQDQSSYWTPSEIALHRMVMIARSLRGGWKLDDNGLLSKGTVTGRPTAVIPFKNPCDQGYDPRKDAPALRLYPGSTFINVNRYRTPFGQYVDRLGCFRDEADCPECGGTPFRLKVENPNPYAKKWEQTFTYCRRCVTPEFLAENERQVEGSTADLRRRGR